MTDLGAEISAFMAQHLDEDEWAAMFAPEGLARHTLWTCGDGWLVGYTTERIRHGKYDGKFAVMAYKPIGKGARSGRAERWERVYLRPFAKRKTARARAEKMYWQHTNGVLRQRDGSYKTRASDA